jgi:hypothetical protein
VETPRYNSKDDRLHLEVTLPSLKINTNPGLIKIHQVDIPEDKLSSEIPTDEENSIKIKDTPGLNKDEKFPTKEESESRSLRRLNPTQELKPLSATDRLNTKPIISQPQTQTNYESNYQRIAREIESEPSKKSNDFKLQMVKLLSQLDTEISSSSDQEKRKEHKSERSKVHLRPGRLKRPG